MITKRGKTLLLTAAACLIAALLLQGCGTAPGINNGKQAAASAPAAVTSADPTETESTAAPGKPAAGPDMFTAAFTTVDKNPLDESIQYELWLAANAPDTADEPAASGAAALQQYVDKYQALVADEGIHYVEAIDAMGMTVETEYWVKGGKFKKYDGINVYLFNGQHFIKYDPDEKTGIRASPDYAALDLDQLTKGMLARLSTSPYQPKDDKKFGAFDCAVFYTDMELDMLGMKMKGSTLYVDKATGMLVNNVTGDPEDKENSTSTYVKSLETGGFGDEVFIVPADVTLEDFN